MKTRACALLFGLAVGLMTTHTANAMSELVSLSLQLETATPGRVVVYQVTVGRAGRGLLEVALTSQGLPEGCTVTFSPSVLRFVGRVPTNQTAIMTITCPEVRPTDTYLFTVTGTARREAITITNEFVAPLYGSVSGLPVLVLDRPTEGAYKLRGTGTTGQTYRIEATTDLARPQWTPIGTTTADLNGRFTLMIAVDDAIPVRFFRAVGPGSISITR